MLSLLEDCPLEVIELMVRELGLKDICSLRESSRTLAIKIREGLYFKTYFRSKHVDMTQQGLQAFVDQTQPARLGCLVQDLVLIGVVNNVPELKSILMKAKVDTIIKMKMKTMPKWAMMKTNPETAMEDNQEEQAKVRQSLMILEQRQAAYRQLHESEMDIDLLSEAFSNLMSNSKTGKLLSLSLEVIVYRNNAVEKLPPLIGGNWKLIWQSATETFHTALSSLAKSSLPIEKLNIFNDRRLQRCSLFYNELANINFKNKGLASLFACLKSLSVSYSQKNFSRYGKDAERIYGSLNDMFYESDSAEYDEETDPDESDEEADSAESEEREIKKVTAKAATESNFIGLTKLLKFCSQLEELELHQYWLEGCRAPERLRFERILKQAAYMDTPPNLKRMTLRGIWVREKHLLAFVRRTKVRKLTICDVRITSGNFRSVFDYCTSNLANIEELCFHGLHEHQLDVYFDEPGTPEFRPFADNGMGESVTLQRAKDQVKQLIDYWVTKVYPDTREASEELLQQRRREYGVDIFGYDL